MDQAGLQIPESERNVSVQQAAGSGSVMLPAHPAVVGSCRSAAECLEAALNTLSRALESNCEDPEVWSHYLSLFSRRGSREEVQEMCEMAVEHAPDYRVWFSVSPQLQLYCLLVSSWPRPHSEMGKGHVTPSTLVYMSVVSGRDDVINLCSSSVPEPGELVRGEGLRVRAPAALPVGRGVLKCDGEAVLPADGGSAVQGAAQSIHGPDGERSGPPAGVCHHDIKVYTHTLPPPQVCHLSVREKPVRLCAERCLFSP